MIRSNGAAFILAGLLAWFSSSALTAGGSEFFAEWKRARAGDPGSEYALGEMYRTGKGAKKDSAKALLWITKAADQGHVAAALRLAEIYKLGWGVPIDHAVGARWLLVAAQAENPKAQHQLGVAYYTGKGVKADLTLANHWVRKAALQGHAQALKDLKVLAQRGENDPVPKGPPQRFAWLKRNAQRGNPDLMQLLAAAYSDGLGTPVDQTRALHWFQRAAEAGQVNAQLDLGIRLVTGAAGVTRDEAAGTQWLKRAAALGSRQAQGLLRALQRSSVPKKRSKAVPAPRKTLQDTFAEMDARRRRLDEYQASQRRAFNDYLDRTGSTFRWRYR